MLEVGAGIGDHTSFFLDRGCAVTSPTRARRTSRSSESAFPGCRVWALDLDAPEAPLERFDVVYCYGTLYHLAKPADALEFLAKRCDGQLLLETCVSFGDELAINLVHEDAADPSQAASGTGCRPTRPWIVDRLRRHFSYVYVTTTQPWHEEFPLEWSADPVAGGAQLTRSVFVASRVPLHLPALSTEIPAVQIRA